MTEEREESGGALPEAVRELFEQMIGHLQWALQVDVDESDPETLRVNLSGGDREELLRNRAEVLEVFQYLSNRIFGRELEGRRLVVDSDGFRAAKEAELKEIAVRLSERVKLTGQREEVGRMNPYERRIVHLAVAEMDGVRTESDGDGVMKRVIIVPAP